MSAIHEDFARLYYHLHPTWTENLSHQSVRILQTIQMTGVDDSEGNCNTV